MVYVVLAFIAVVGSFVSGALYGRKIGAKAVAEYNKAVAETEAELKKVL